MNRDVEDNWNTIVLKVATSGGFMVQCGTKYNIFITDVIIEGRTDQIKTIFKSYKVSSAEYKKILKEALMLKDELYMMNEEDKSKKSAARSRKSRTKRPTATRNKTAKN